MRDGPETRVVGALVAGGASALTVLLVDAMLRAGSRFSWLQHFTGAFIFFSALAAAVGVFGALWWELERLVALAMAPRARLGVHIAAALRGLLAATCSWSTAEWTFSGRSASAGPASAVGPAVMTALIAAASCGSALWQHTTLEPRTGSYWLRARRFAVVHFGLALLLFALDQTQYPFLYDRLHTLLEALAWLCLFSGYYVLARVTLRNEPPESATRATRVRTLAWLLLASGFGYAVAPALRARADALLSHTWLEERYVGRMVRRSQELKVTLDGKRSLDMLRLDDLTERYTLLDTTLDPSWSTPTQGRPLPPELAQAKNLVVFYVDTLRDDVSRDARLMPHLARFRAESLDFLRAYALGSDTLRSLPELTSGNQFVHHTHPGDLLRLAATAGHQSTLLATRSARDFLSKLRPSFQFQTTVDAPDDDGAPGVWGYGGHRHTAHQIVDDAETYLRARPKGEPFLLWMLHFDLHAWRELDESYVTAQQRRFGLLDSGRTTDRYDVVARAVDEEFGRFLSLLAATGHAQDTAVLFVSDHGEGLGQEGFWVHSVFLWESLLRVPLALRLPGVAPRAIATTVSLLDVAPTLAPMFGGGEALYHGQDLLPLTRPGGELAFRRRLPLVLRSATRDRLSRVGVLEVETGQKLVIRIQAVFPELYEFAHDASDRDNLAAARPGEVARLLNIVARSPVFPRKEADFSFLEFRGELGRALTSRTQTHPTP